MTSRFFNATLVSLLAFVLITPAAFFMAPQKTHAQLFQTPPLQGFTMDPSFQTTDELMESAEASRAAFDKTVSEGAFIPGHNPPEAGCLPQLTGIAAAGYTEIVTGETVEGTGTGIKTSPASLLALAGLCITSVMSIIQQTITSAAAVSSSAALQALVIDAYVLQPLAFVLSGNLLKLITQGVIAFVIGKANGTGIPQFVADIRASLQTVSDTHALAYFDQFIRSSRSPWNTAILSQLRKEYLNETSLAGFWAANMDTLQYTSPYAFGYLNGNWAQGGVASWFALTTQFQNNPYLLYPTVKEQLASVIGPGVPGATGARVQDISNGQGFVSWCGSSDGFLGEMTTDVRAGANAAGVDQAANDAYDQAYNAAIAAGENAEATAQAAYSAAYDQAYKAAIAKAGTSELQATEAAIAAGRAARDEARNAALARAANATEEAKEAAQAARDAAFAGAKAANAGNSFLGVAPGDPCTNADGTTGTIKTPGSVIMAALNKALGGQQDNVVRMGNVGPEINNILANIGVVLKTVNFATQILGGPGSSGIFGVDQPSGVGSVSALRQYADSPGNLGVTNDDVCKDALKLSSALSDKLKLVAKYETAIHTIRDAANTASTSVMALINSCKDQTRDDAQTVLTAEIAPVFARLDTASTTIAAVRKRANDIQNPSVSVGGGSCSNDLQAFNLMPPTLAEVRKTNEDAVASSTASVASPPGSLFVSGGSTVDRMNLLSKNAATLLLACVAPAAP